MRYAGLIGLLLLVACGTSNPAQSEVARQLNGAWTADDGMIMVFDFDADRVLMDGSDIGAAIDHVEGSTVFLKDRRDGRIFRIRVIGDNTAEWDSDTSEPLLLHKVP